MYATTSRHKHDSRKQTRANIDIFTNLCYNSNITYQILCQKPTITNPATQNTTSGTTKTSTPASKNDADYPTPNTQNLQTSEDHKTTFGTIFLVVFLWLIFLAPLTLFFTWEDAIIQFIFWTGLAIIATTYILAFYNAIQTEKRKKK